LRSLSLPLSFSGFTAKPVDTLPVCLAQLLTAVDCGVIALFCEHRNNTALYLPPPMCINLCPLPSGLPVTSSELMDSLCLSPRWSQTGLSIGTELVRPRIPGLTLAGCWLVELCTGGDRAVAVHTAETKCLAEIPSN